MSVLKYLSAGKSLIGLKQNEVRYRMGEAGALPKFDSKRNPFRSRTTPAAATARPARSAPIAEPEFPTQPQIQAPTVTLVSPAPAQPAPASAVIGETIVPTATKISSITLVWNRARTSVVKMCRRIVVGSGDMAGSVVHGVKALAWWRRKRNAGMPQTAKPPVQGELSLDSVKVVRNDLTDADFEVVPRSRKTMVGDGESKDRTSAQAPGPKLLEQKSEPASPLANPEPQLVEAGRGE